MASLATQKKFISRNGPLLPRARQLTIVDIVVNAHGDEVVQETPGGLAVFVDELSDATVTTVYHFVRTALEQL